ncbi:receptor/non-receptor type protein-tyrosine phosphatase [Gonapodya prolifera JEL478]|uniref:Receptor/non-receptor type protein-tyrosine phosphatase n=1 Tax=Gonapodya prolifera (strain JEL478) TaxID=1344416 RepID=A0A139ATJ5_GONPJ|nr:receptor/non-receptor type protein-tyrosine phosphatase [Gonapodya prolifera JEL478]|eukprot:KXS19815.1 receptor/non-receptor type protein-tyrosine phosphatase [Gonapodya prolifera JEL478]
MAGSWCANPPFAPSPGPPLIHCSAGVGRTGTYIVVDVLIKAMREWGAQPGSTKPLVRAMGSTNLEEDPVAALVKHLRTQRVLMVQTPEQFGYIYECLVEAARGVGNA